MAIKISNTTVIDDSRKTTNLRLTTDVRTTDITSTAGTVYFLNAAGLTITLPSSPTAGDVVGIVEVAGDTTSAINRNGENIQGLAENLTIDTAYASVNLVYVDASIGWALADI